MTVRITRPIQGGTVRAPASKSEAQRLLLCAALADSETFVACPEISRDIGTMARCLDELGAAVRYNTARRKFACKFTRQAKLDGRGAARAALPRPPAYCEGGFTVTPLGRTASGSQNRADIFCGESGAALRFLLPVCAALGIPAAFHMEGRLPKRPISALCGAMAANGCVFSEPGLFPLTLEGKLKSGQYILPGDISSQFVSGLLFALPLLDGDSKIHITGALQSRPYADMTLNALRLFGIKAQQDDHGFCVSGGQVYLSPKTVRVGGDWSGAAFWLAAGAIAKTTVTCTGLDLASKQGDRAITKLLSRFGARVSQQGDAVTVYPGELNGIEISAEDIPDLVPALAAAAACARGKTVIKNAARLRFKESDRIHTTAQALSMLGADITETADGLIIIGKSKLPGGDTQSFGDHRIAMATAILSGACEGPVTIRGAHAAQKSYPAFFEDFADGLGAQLRRIED
ncbi:MAG: 3-phosphoshikimate 1-carboxyvinyltransferase [Oscillospiraceae bacterium]|nr:3-phosphoshikimate 1-carboxyvinyltransferase [Oscillospiraceae bacterium]